MSTTIRVKRSTGKIERLDIEEYLRGVVPAEIGRGAPLEAMKAQAVASRTYALRHIIADRSKSYDVTDTSSNQVYKPEKITAQSDEAICATAGLVMVYDGAPIGAWFSSSNGGRTKSSAEKWGGTVKPYSICRLDPFDTHGGGGHGVGMSQYGAMEMARRGYKYTDILDFYFNAAFNFFDIYDLSYVEPGILEHGNKFGRVNHMATYHRLIKALMSGEDVRAVKDRLVELGYLKSSTHNTMGLQSVAAVKAFQRDKGLRVDGIVGPATWFALFPANDSGTATEKPSDKQPESDTSAPVFKRNLKFGSEGEDARAVQKRLIELGYSLGKCGADGEFGGATKTAVLAFQTDKRLDRDGIVGKKTWEALFGANHQATEPEPTPEPVGGIPANIGATAAAAIRADLGKVSDLRHRIVLTALREAYDPDKPRDYPYSLYIRGGNLYNTDLSLNVIDAARIETGAKRQPQYYSGGSKQMMLAAVKQHPGQITGADCSGGIVGLLRKFDLVKPTFDAIANGLCDSGHSRKISKADLQPGDWVGLSGHIGLYAGGGYVVEWYGQNFGCQLTKLGTKRKAWDFVGKKYRTRAEWTKYRRPKYY